MAKNMTNRDYMIEEIANVHSVNMALITFILNRRCGHKGYSLHSNILTALQNLENVIEQEADELLNPTRESFEYMQENS